MRVPKGSKVDPKGPYKAHMEAASKSHSLHIIGPQHDSFLLRHPRALKG